MTFCSSVMLVGLQHDIRVGSGLPLKVATSIRDVFFQYCSKTQQHVDLITFQLHQLYYRLCSSKLMQIRMSIHFQVLEHRIIEPLFLYIYYVKWYVTAIAIGSDICLMDCRMHTLNVDRFMVLLHLSSCLLFRSVTSLLKSGARTVAPARYLCSPARRSMWYEFLV